MEKGTNREKKHQRQCRDKKALTGSALKEMQPVPAPVRRLEQELLPSSVQSVSFHSLAA